MYFDNWGNEYPTKEEAMDGVVAKMTSNDYVHELFYSVSSHDLLYWILSDEKRALAFCKEFSEQVAEAEEYFANANIHEGV